MKQKVYVGIYTTNHKPENSDANRSYQDVRFIIASRQEEATKIAEKISRKIFAEYHKLHFWDMISVHYKIVEVQLSGFKITVEPLEDKVNSR